MNSDPVRGEQTLALGYPGIDAEAVIYARNLGRSISHFFRNVVHRDIASEEGFIDPLRDARDVLLHTVIAGTSPEDFDAVFDRMYEDYMNLGGRAIMEEREQVWIEMFGDADRMPD